MKIQGAIPPGYVKAMEKKDAKELNPQAYINQGKNQSVILSPDDQLTISFLQEESEKNYSKLRDIVKDMLRRQGVEVDKLEHLKDEDLEGVVIDEQAQEEAAQMIGPDGPLNAENTSDRILKFAKAISGGDKSKLGKIRDAIEKGFEEAKKMLGGELPEISNKTYDLVMEKLDAWENGEEVPEE